MKLPLTYPNEYYEDVSASHLTPRSITIASGWILDDVELSVSVSKTVRKVFLNKCVIFINGIPILSGLTPLPCGAEPLLFPAGSMHYYSI